MMTDFNRGMAKLDRTTQKQRREVEDELDRLWQAEHGEKPPSD